MPLTTSAGLLEAARKGGYAVGAFNVENMEMAQAVVEAAEEARAPVILQTTPSTVQYGGLNLYYANISALAKAASVPVVLHLDHGNSFELAVRAIREGYTSIMIDGSHCILEENIALTRRVVEVAAPNGIPVEAELGRVGGKEDDLDGGKGGYTDPEEARRFVLETGVSALAVAIGTAHGVYSGIPQLDVGRLGDIRKIVNIPLVLHGASGLSDESVVECIKEGICKVNFATELRIAYSEGVKTTLHDAPQTFDPKTYGKSGRERVRALVKNRMNVCGCCQKAGLETRD